MSITKQPSARGIENHTEPASKAGFQESTELANSLARLAMQERTNREKLEQERLARLREVSRFD